MGRYYSSGFYTWWQGMDWVHLTQGRDKWQAPVSMIMNLLVPKKHRVSSLAERLFASLEKRCSTDLVIEHLGERKRKLARPRHRWQGNIKVYLAQAGSV
jgi:hypothetical protein